MSIFSIFTLLGGLAFFIYGMNQMSQSLEKIANHIDRLQSGECTIERGFVLADILNNYERLSDHCSNIAIAVISADKEKYL